MSPRKRPTFQELHSSISKYIERIAGYLQMGFNPFAGGMRRQVTVGGGGRERELGGAEEYGLQVQVTPPSVPLNGQTALSQ